MPRIVRTTRIRPVCPWSCFPGGRMGRGMRIVICGAGDVGRHVADMFAAAEHSITVVDRDRNRLQQLRDTLDVGVLEGNCAHAPVLEQARANRADLVIAATDRDEINLLTAQIAKRLGAGTCIARVHDRAYVDRDGFDYQGHCGIDRIVCPEYSTAQAVAHVLRNPLALAIEDFAHGRIQMQEFPVGERSTAVGRPLSEVRFPQRVRLLAIERNGQVSLAAADSEIHAGDVVTLIGEPDAIEGAVKVLGGAISSRRRIVLMGSTPTTVWLCESLRDRSLAVRLFVRDPEEAEELAERLTWVTVIRGDPTDKDLFAEENLDQADTFVALTDDDETNILASAWVKSAGIKQVIAVVQKPRYTHLLAHVGIDLAFSPRAAAAREINRELDRGPVRWLANLAKGALAVYEIRVPGQSDLTGVALQDLKGRLPGAILGIQRGREVKVPGPVDRIEAGDIILVLTQRKSHDVLQKAFAAR